MSLHSSYSVNGEGSTPKDALYKILDKLGSLNSWKEKQERKENGQNRAVYTHCFRYKKTVSINKSV